MLFHSITCFIGRWTRPTHVLRYWSVRTLPTPLHSDSLHVRVEHVMRDGLCVSSYYTLWHSCMRSTTTYTVTSKPTMFLYKVMDDYTWPMLHHSSQPLCQLTTLLCSITFTTLMRHTSATVHLKSLHLYRLRCYSNNMWNTHTNNNKNYNNTNNSCNNSITIINKKRKTKKTQVVVRTIKFARTRQTTQLQHKLKIQ